MSPMCCLCSAKQGSSHLQLIWPLTRKAADENRVSFLPHDCSVAFHHKLAIITQRIILANCTIVGHCSERVMGKRNAEPELTHGNEASASPGKTWSWGGRRREAVTPARDALHYRHGASEAAGLQEVMSIPNPVILFLPRSQTEPLCSFLPSFCCQWGSLPHVH